MNIDTGEIHRFASREEMLAAISGIQTDNEVFTKAVPQIKLDDAMGRLESVANNIVELRGEPDPQCRKCFGRGHTGRNLITNLFVPCSCCEKQ